MGIKALAAPRTPLNAVHIKTTTEKKQTSTFLNVRGSWNDNSLRNHNVLLEKDYLQNI